MDIAYHICLLRLAYFTYPWVRQYLTSDIRYGDTLNPLEADELLTHSDGVACPRRDLL